MTYRSIIPNLGSLIGWMNTWSNLVVIIVPVGILILVVSVDGKKFASIAQLVEHRPYTAGVIRSSRITRTIPRH